MEFRDEEFLFEELENLFSFENAFNELGLTDSWEDIKPLIKESLIFQENLANNDDIPLGASKIGGKADLPKDNSVTGIEKLDFLCQINLKDISSILQNSPLPQKGLLSFFFHQNDWQANLNDKSLQLVYYFEDIKSLKSSDVLSTSIETPRTIEFQKVLSVPHPYSLYRENILNAFDNDEEKIDIFETANKHSNKSKIFGNVDNIQSPVEQELDNYLGNKKEDWVLLCQFDAYKEFKIGAIFYFMITKGDLIKGNFANTRMIGQC